MTAGDKSVTLRHREKALIPSGSWGWALWFCGLGAVALAGALPVQAASQDRPSATAGRFVLVLEGEAVKDRTTGLIWEQAPDSFHGVWSEAPAHCLAKTVGGKQGWRVPTVQELSSLLDQSQQDPALPQGHPFANIKSAIYWSATPSEKDDIVAWHVSFLRGEAVTDQKSQTRRVWCVLGEAEQLPAR